MRTRIYIALLFSTFFGYVNAQLLSTLPPDAQRSIIWYADYEEGTLEDWSDPNSLQPGGEIVTSGIDAVAIADERFAHSGKYSAKTSITNAYKGENGNKGIKFRRWADSPIDKEGEYLPKEAYYSSFLYFPNIYNPTKKSDWNAKDEGFWNLFEFASLSEDGTTKIQWTVNVHHDSGTNKMYLFIESSNSDKYLQLASSRISVPVNKWMHLEAYYKASDAGKRNGAIALWQDGNLLFELTDVITTEEDKNIAWSVANYTDHIEGESVEGKASLYVDDSMISSSAINPYLEAVVALPLELVSFDVVNAGNEVEVKWRTANESNIKHYIVQRRHEAEDTFHDITMLGANNQSDEMNDYDIYDLEKKTVGTHYYRLRVLDNDGQEYFSDLQSITIKGGNFFGLKVYPNPVINELYLEGLNEEEETLLINVYDVYGALMYSKSEVAKLSAKINLSDLIPGIYIVQVSKGLDRYSKKIIKH